MSENSVGRELATRVGGTFLSSADTIHTPGHWIACRPTGRVVLDDTYQLGWLSDGVEVLVSRYAAYVAGGVARLPGDPRKPVPVDDDKQAA